MLMDLKKALDDQGLLIIGLSCIKCYDLNFEKESLSDGFRTYRL